MATILLLLLLAVASNTVEGDTNVTECPSAWKHVGQLCVVFMNESVAWWKAWNKCSKLGDDTHLAYVESMVENDVLAGMMAMDGIEEVWIGLSDSKVTGSFVWADNEPVNYTNYEASTLVDATTSNRHCANIRSESDYKWHLDYCLEVRNYVCRKDVS